MDDNAKGLKTSEHWPFHPQYLTQRVPRELITLIIAGMSERLESPVVIWQNCYPDSDRECNKDKFIYPVDETRRFYRYPEFCKVFHEKVKDGGELCMRDSCSRAWKILSGKTDPSKGRLRCHLGLNVCSEIVNASGYPLAVCTGGKFIQRGEETLVEKRLKKLEKQGVLSSEQKQELLRCIRKDDCYKDYDEFRDAYKKEMEILNDMVARHLVQHRKEKEWTCREKVLGSLYEIADDSEDLQTSLEDTLSILCDFLSVKYLALFLGLKQDDLVLPLVAQSGLEWDEVNSVHFNWRKSGLTVDDKAFDTLEWLSTERTSRESFGNYVTKGLKGHSKDNFFPALCLLPVGHQYRGILVVGQLKDETVESSDLLSDELGGMDFLQNVGHLIVTHALSKCALQSSVQHDKRRDLIVALTAHSIKASLQRFWDATERVRFYWQKPEHAERIRRATDEMIKIIRTMKKNVHLAMIAPETAVTPDIHRSEMKVEKINLAALLHNCVDPFELQAIAKHIKIVIKDEVNELPLIYGDRYMLNLVFSNILDNAIKYSKIGEEVCIYAESEPLETIKITIKDFGWGIPKKDLERIFEPGFQSPKVDKYQRRGVGLGMHQALKFVELHRGDLLATSHPGYSEAPLSSHIVRFFVRLPIKGTK